MLKPVAEVLRNISEIGADHEREIPANLGAVSRRHPPEESQQRFLIALDGVRLDGPALPAGSKGLGPV